MKLFQSISNKCNVLVIAAALAVSGASFGEAKATGGSSRLMWFGLSSNTLLLSAPAGVGILSNSAISLMLRFSPKFDLQTYFTMDSADPVLLSAGAVAKFNIIGDASRGLHVGGGFGMGDQGSSFFFTFAGMFGLHYEILSNLLLSADTGLRLNLGGAGTNFGIGGASNLLGLSLHLAI